MDSHSPEWVWRLATPDSLKTLAIALVTSFFTVCLMEPIKAAIQRRTRRREVRRSLYHEMVLNYRALRGQVILSKNMPDMTGGIPDRFRSQFKKSSFEMAQRDPVLYYSLSPDERYWIELHYSGMQNVIEAKFKGDDQTFRCADFTADNLLTMIKNRDLNKRLIFRASPPAIRKEFRERLPSIRYVDIEPPRLFERIRRKFDE